jgi:hypothetical protein
VNDPAPWFVRWSEGDGHLREVAVVRSRNRIVQVTGWLAVVVAALALVWVIGAAGAGAGG